MIINFADRIRDLREKSGMTQTDLAKKLGISRSAVNSWEMSLSSPSIANIVELTQIFHVSSDYLLTLSGQVSLDISDLDHEEQEVVYRLIDCLRKKKQ
ncbi:MAG: helix-turn-helix transcriptional regulator [Clostridia bacterium]|nr:helix-turn-helix transcriptional regulator [Clostridia bacterium]